MQESRDGVSENLVLECAVLSGIAQQSLILFSPSLVQATCPARKGLHVEDVQRSLASMLTHLASPSHGFVEFV